MTRIVNIDKTPAVSTHSGDLIVLVLAIVFIVLTGVGMFFGNVFETYHNGSSL